MRVAFCADVHLGNHNRYPGRIEVGLNQRAREVVDALDRAIQIAKGKDCDAFVVLGDLFDGTRPQPQLIAKVQDLMAGAPHPVLLLGNHEMVTDVEGDNSLAPLKLNCWVIERPCIHPLSDLKLAVIPFQRGNPAEWLGPTLDELGLQPGAVLCLHMGIRDRETPFFLQGTEGAVDVGHLDGIVEDLQLAAVFSGDWHERRFWRSHGNAPIIQVGTLCPTGWDNPGFTDYGFMAIWDSETSTGESISIPGPRFVKVASEKEFAEVIARNADRLYVEWISPPAELAAANAAIREARKDGLIVDGGAFVDKAIQQEAARASARAAASAETLEEAVSAWVSEMELEEGVERARVLERARGYLEVR